MSNRQIMLFDSHIYIYIYRTLDKFWKLITPTNYICEHMVCMGYIRVARSTDQPRVSRI